MTHVNFAGSNTFENEESQYYTKSQSTNRFIDANGDSMTGVLKQFRDPVENEDVVNKKYVDDLQSKLQEEKHNMNKSLNMNGNKIENLKDPSGSSDAVNVKYLAGQIHYLKQEIEQKATQQATLISNHLQSNSLLLDGTTKPINDIDWNNKGIINLRDPIENQDVATKNYVDSTNFITIVDHHYRGNRRAHGWFYTKNKPGYPMIRKGKLISMSLSGKKPACSVTLLVNNNLKHNYVVTKPENETFSSIDFEDGLELQRGDRIGFSDNEHIGAGSTIVLLVKIFI